MTSNWKRWITLALCGIAGSAIYKLPYLRETYYDAMQQVQERLMLNLVF